MPEQPYPASPMRAARMLLAAVVGLAVLARLALVLMVGEGPATRVPASGEYLAIAYSLAEGRGFVLPPGPTGKARLARHMPGYPLLAAVAGRISDVRVRGVLISQAVCGGVTLILAAWAAARVAGMWAGLVAAAILAFDPYEVYFCGLALPTVPLGMAVAAAIVLGIKYLDAGADGVRHGGPAGADLAAAGLTPPRLRPGAAPGSAAGQDAPGTSAAAGWLWAAGAGLATAAAAYLEPWAAGLVLASGVAALASRRRRRLIVGWAVATAVLLAALAPWLIRNVSQVGAAVLTTTVGERLLAGAADGSAGGATADPAAAPGPEGLDEMAEDVSYLRSAAGRIGEAPIRWLLSAMVRIGRLWSPGPLLAGDEGPVHPLAGYTSLLPAAALAGAGVWVLRRRRALLVWLLAAPAYLTVVHAVVAAPAYDRLEVMPPLAVLGGVGLAALVGRKTANVES